MKFTTNWLASYIPEFSLAPQELADRLTMLGLEVDAVVPCDQYLQHVVAAKVVDTQPVKKSDHLSCCTVDAGDGERTVICGAPNVTRGMTAALALPGATVVGGLTVAERKVFGILSQGMLCAEDELGIADSHDGIMVLPDAAVPGTPVADVLDMVDTQIEVDLTPNRGDCASVFGLAREAAAAAGLSAKYPDIPHLPDGESTSFSVTIEDQDDCPRYTARLVKGICVGPSPWWLKRLLLAAGIRPINNVVDVTNFVMLELGQPLHAFDFNRLQGPSIIVKKGGGACSSISTLDGVKQTVDESTLLICDQAGPVAVAGVMGGAATQVIDTTMDVLLESACFDPVIIQKAARQLNLHSESSYRFERGVDPEGVRRALDRAASLLVELAGGEFDKTGLIDLYPGKKEPQTILLRHTRVNDLLGIDVSSQNIAKLLNSIEISADETEEGDIMVRPPSFRRDLEREIDLVEEIARLEGYDAIPATLPTVTVDFSTRSHFMDVEKNISQVMIAMDFSQAINYSFDALDSVDRLGLSDEDHRRKCVRLANPLSEEMSILRTTLLPGLLQNVCRNINHMRPDIRLFEIGKAFYSSEEESALPHERTFLGVVLSGRRYPESSLFDFGTTSVDFRDLRGAAEAVFHRMRLDEKIVFSIVPSVVEPYWSHDEVLSCHISDGTEVGRLGRLESKTLKQFAIKEEVFYLELDLDTLIGLCPAPIVFQQLPKYPPVKRDIAVIVRQSVAAGDILTAVQKEDMVEHCEIFDIYQGKPVEKGWKSVGLTMTYRSHTSTLDDQAADALHKKIVGIILTTFDGRFREA